jgi:sulfoxide reductase heme-binding subunit YedZ
MEREAVARVTRLAPPSADLSRRPRFRPRRLGRRLLRHHLPLAAASAGLMAAILAVLPIGDPSFRLSMSTAYTGLVLLAATLAIGPLNLLLRRPNPVSSDLRRDLGLWAAGFGLAHTYFGLQVHLRAILHQQLFRPAADGTPELRLEGLTFANDTGLIAALVLALLLVLSNDLALRRLGTRRWKALQRLNYAVLGLVAVHAILFQRLERREPPYVLGFALVVLAVGLIQGAGLWRQVAGRPRHGS